MLAACCILADHLAQAEASDRLGGFLLLQSMAGGTGAGLGTFLVESLRCLARQRAQPALTPLQRRLPFCLRAQPLRVAVRVWRGDRAELQHASDAGLAAGRG